MATLTRTVTLSSLHCSVCSVVFAMDQEFIRQRRADRKTFYCPNGHSQWYPGKTAEKERDEARAQLEAATRTTKFLREEVSNAREQRDRAKRSAAAYKGAVTKARKRAGAGLCPVKDCRRRFANVAEHMLTKHPDFTPEEHTHG